MRNSNATLMVLLATMLSACTHRVVQPVVVPPVVVTDTVVPVVVAPPSRWTLPTAIASANYRARIVAKLERDSAGQAQRESFETRAFVSLQQQRDTLGSFRGSGRVDSFTVRGLEQALAIAPNATVAPLAPISIAFDAMLNSTTSRVIARPALVNECDQAEAGATALVRELLVRIPASIALGDQWRDSSTAFVCRAGIPITVKQHSTYQADKSEEHSGRTELLIRRTVETWLDGTIRSAWRTVELNGTGRGDEVIRVDAASGSVRTINGTSTLSIRVTDSARRDQARSQAVVQSLELSFERILN